MMSRSVACFLLLGAMAAPGVRADEHSRDLAGVSLGEGYDDAFRTVGHCDYGGGDRSSGVLNCTPASGRFQARFAGDGPTVAYSMSLSFCSGEGFLAIEHKVEKKYGMALGETSEKDFAWTRADGLHVELLGPQKLDDPTDWGTMAACALGDGYMLTISDDGIDKRYREAAKLKAAAESARVPTPNF